MKKTQESFNSTLRARSDKKTKQLLLENELKKKLYKKQNGRCKKCGKPLEWDWAGWDKHEIISRAQGGDPLDENNCELHHRQCHMKITEHRDS